MYKNITINSYYKGILLLIVRLLFNEYKYIRITKTEVILKKHWWSLFRKKLDIQSLILGDIPLRMSSYTKVKAPVEYRAIIETSIKNRNNHILDVILSELNSTVIHFIPSFHKELTPSSNNTFPDILNIQRLKRRNNTLDQRETIQLISLMEKGRLFPYKNNNILAE